ncbi:ATP-binding protein [Roseivirga sp. BDSF3-8]|uniref:HAMP domain-containing sensor histidine kinase n=1 Tax=Roseivirga sp. BDSF3-8 TaxID=3241598 RepID=UPI003531EE60
MKLKTQIHIGYFFIVALSILLAGVFGYYLQKLGKASDDILNVHYRSVKAGEELLQSLSKMEQIFVKYAIEEGYDKEKFKEVLFREKRIFQSNLFILENSLEASEEVEVLLKIRHDWEEFKPYLWNPDTVSREPVRYVGMIQDHTENLRAHIRDVVNLNHSALSKNSRRSQEIYHNARTYMVLIIALVIIISGLAAYFIPQRIMRPVENLTSMIRRISSGEYGHRIYESPNNELGELMRAYNDMSVKLEAYEFSNLSEIRAQKGRIESIIRSLNEGLIILDEEQKIVLINEVAGNVLGSDENDLRNRTLSSMVHDNPVAQHLYKELIHFEQHYRGAAQSRSEDNFLRIINKDGEYEFYAKDITRVYNGDKDNENKFIGYIITLKDVTSFKNSDETKNNFIATVSHELKTPLSAMNMSMMLLLDQRFGSLNDEQRNIAQSMRKEVKRLIKMVSELLDLSQVEAGHIDLEKENICPSLIVEYAKVPLESELEEKSLTLTIHIEEELPDLHVDAEKVSWVLHNFLSNAIRFSHPHSQIEVEVFRDLNYIEFSVKDYGPGINEENQAKLFKKFVQIEKKGSGLGLGLAISKEVIQVHEGNIGVESAPGKGSRFFFRIPFTGIMTENSFATL